MTRARDLAAFVSNADGDIKFDTDTLFIDSSANAVGIGTTAPHDAGANFSILTLNGAKGGGIVFSDDDVNQHMINTTDDNSLRFTRGSGLSDETMRIDSSGRVGIGGTPNTNWRDDIANQEVLMLGTEATLYSDGGVTTELWNNAYVDDSDVFKNISTRGASRYFQYSGVHKWFVAASASAGSTITSEIQTTPKLQLDTDGLKFNGDTAAENALNDYEEGTFTPLLSGSRPGGGDPTYNVQLGLYTKIGNMVEFNLCVSCVASSLEVQANDLVITGLPFTNLASSSPTGQNFPTPTVWPQAGINNTSTTQGYGSLIANDSTNITIYGHVSGTGVNYVNVKYNQLSTASSNNSFQIRITGTYRTAS